MIGKRRRDRRRQARAAIERYEEQARAAMFNVAGANAEAERMQALGARERTARLAIEQRLEDANAELARWGLEPVTRDEPGADHAPTRYRRSGDWRTFRTGEELVDLLERSNIDPDGAVQPAAIRASAPFGVDADVEPVHLPCVPGTQAAGWRCIHCGTLDYRETCPGRLPRYEFDAPAVSPLDAPVPDRLAALRRQRDEARELHRVCQDEYRSVDAGRRDALAEVERLLAELAEVRAAYIQAELEAPDVIEPGQPIAPDHPAREVLREARLETVELREQIEWLRNARESDLAVIATELGWPGEDPITASGLCLRIRDAITTAIETTDSTRTREAEAEAERAGVELAKAFDGVGELASALREAEEDRLRVMRELSDALTAASEAEGALASTRVELAEAERQLGEAQHRIGDLQGDVNVYRAGSARANEHAEGLTAQLTATRAELAEQSGELLTLRAAAGDPGDVWVDRELFEAQRTEAERLQRQNDVLTGEVTRLKLLQENLTPLPPAQGDVITLRLRDGRTQRCTVKSIMPVGDLGFSVSLEPESPPL